MLVVVGCVTAITLVAIGGIYDVIKNTTTGVLEGTDVVAVPVVDVAILMALIGVVATGVTILGTVATGLINEPEPNPIIEYEKVRR